MKSHILGVARLDEERLGGEVAAIDRFAARDDYSEYSFGLWRSYVLANGTGDQDDATFRGYEGSPQVTELGRTLPYLMQLVNETFHTDHLKWVRLFTVQNGFIISHRDFVEFDRDFVRVHIPVHTDPGCLHSEEEAVFHMRRGEVWFLDASTVHSACSLSSFKRISLCLDFVDTGVPLASLLRERATTPPEPQLVPRPPLEDGFGAALTALGALADPVNFRDLAGFLAKIHFYRQAHAAACFDWLIEVAAASGRLDLVHKANQFKRFNIETRVLGERFTF